MALLDDILAWTSILPLWQRDAARRLFQKPGGLSQEDFDALYVLLKAAHSLHGSAELTPDPLSAGHLPTTLAQGDTVVLKGMRALKHVNRIASDQSLPFETSGMTVIYGGNGSGKSGYARVMKRACRCRDQSEQVLPDATDATEQGTIPEAVFDIDVNGTPKPIQWLSTAEPPEDIASIAIFDRHCARIYVTEEQEVAYMPYGLDILEALATTVLPELNRRLEEELKGLNTDLGLLDPLESNTEVWKQLDDLSHETDAQEITVLATLSDEEKKRIDELNRLFGETDPVAKAKQLRLSAGRLKELVGQIDAVAALVDDDAETKLKTIAQEAVTAQQAEQAAAKVLHSGESLLLGTGESVWKTLFEAARKFSTEVAYPETSFPNTDDDAVCVLCQQPVREAAERLNRFEDYIQDDVAKTAVSKSEKLNEAVESFKKAELTVGVDGVVGDELDQLDATLRPSIKDFEQQIDVRRKHMLEAVESSSWDELAYERNNARQKIRNLAASQYRSARDFERASDEVKRDELKREKDELETRKMLSSYVQDVLALLDRLKEKNSLEACKTDLKTRPISTKLRELASAAVTSTLKDALDEEFENLGIGHVSTKLNERNAKGVVMHQLLLDLPTSNKVEDILSEGEQRAIALGSFLAELKLADHSAAIVFDDPVSSLDSKRRGKLAKRLASESQVRQVIVFTHDTVFLDQLQSECGELGQSPGLRFLEKTKGFSGMVSQGLPWDHRGYKERIDSLEKKPAVSENF